LRRQPSLRAQLNQIRMWVRQGRTDAWIAHKIDVSVDELARFKREHDLEGGEEGPRGRPADAMSVPAPEPRSEDLDEDDEEEEEEEQDVAQADEKAAQRERPRSRSRRRPRRTAAAPVAAKQDEDDEDEDEEEGAGRELDDGDADGAARRRRRGRRGGRRHRPRRTAYEATFDHGGEGYGLWLDPAVADNAVYAEHWAGHRPVSVTIEENQIVIRRTGEDDDGDDD
jgi:hypothetical protein